MRRRLEEVEEGEKQLGGANRPHRGPSRSLVAVVVEYPPVGEQCQHECSQRHSCPLTGYHQSSW